MRRAFQQIAIYEMSDLIHIENKEKKATIFKNKNRLFILRSMITRNWVNGLVCAKSTKKAKPERSLVAAVPSSPIGAKKVKATTSSKITSRSLKNKFLNDFIFDK
jgi:hypothetical protein